MRESREMAVCVVGVAWRKLSFELEMIYYAFVFVHWFLMISIIFAYLQIPLFHFVSTRFSSPRGKVAVFWDGS